MKNKVYLVVFDWSCGEDEHETEIEVFDTYKKAVDYYNELIANEKNPELSWASSAFNENEKLRRYFHIDEVKPDITQENDSYWHIYCEMDWERYDYIKLLVKEIK